MSGTCLMIFFSRSSSFSFTLIGSSEMIEYQVKENGGVVMVNFYSCYVINDCDKRNATIMDVVRQ